MPSKNDSWGIEIGANAIKAIRLVRKGHQIHLAEYDILPFKQILTTPDLDVEEAIQVNLDTFLSKHDVAKSTVMVSVPGHTAFARFAKLPPVEPKKIPDIVRFEAVQQIPFPIDQVEWDYQVFQHEGLPDVEVGIFAITKERVMQFLNNYRRVEMRVDGITLSPLAVYNTFAYEQAQDTEHEGTIYLDIGTSCTDVIISEPDGLWMRTLPIGGNNFTEALVRSFKLSFPKAERLKREAGSSKYARQIFQAMRPVFAELVQELQRSLGYYQSLHRESRLTRLVGVGSTFRLPGLQKFLKQQLQMDVTRPNAFERLEVDGRRESEFAQHSMNMATAYGLALQGLGEERISANLLPQTIQVRRMWKAKEPWIAGAAACVVAAVGLVGGRYMLDRAAYGSEENEQARKDTLQVIEQAERYKNSFEQNRGEIDPAVQIEIRRGMLDYRQLWPKILDDVQQVAMSVNPQRALMGTNYEEAIQIPRGQRQRLHIESITSSYLPIPTDSPRTSPSGEAAAQPTEPTEGEEEDQSSVPNRYTPQYNNGQMLSAEAFWGEFEADEAAYQEALQARREEGWRPPRIEITMTGRTTYEDGVGLLSQQVVAWLKTHTERQDRPYRLVVRDAEVLSIDTVAPEDIDQPAARGGSTPSRGRPTPSRAGRGERYPSEEAPGSDTGAEEGEERVLELTFDDLLPRQPVELRPRAVEHSKFTVRWTVELLRPEKARRAERHGAAPPGDGRGPDPQQAIDGQPQQDDAANKSANESATDRQAARPNERSADQQAGQQTDQQTDHRAGQRAGQEGAS